MRLSKTIIVGLAAVAAAAVSLPASAHHGRGVYIIDQIDELQGTVKSYEWRNPHVYLYVNRELADGSVEEWVVEMQNPRAMGERGWTPDSLESGEEITMTYSPHGDSERRMALGNTVIKTDGTILHVRQLLAPQVVEDDQRADGIAGRWNISFSARGRAAAMGGGMAPAMGGMGMGANLDPAIAAEFPNAISEAQAFVPNLTDKGKAALKTFDVNADDNPWCTPITTPIILRYPGPKTITVTDELVTMKLSSANRRIHIGAAMPPEVEKSIHGYSIGHWEDDTLVVETAHFAYHPWGHENGIPSSEAKHVVERYTPAEDGKAMNVSWVMRDDEYLLEPIRGQRTWAYAPNMQIFDIGECDPEVAKRFLTEG